MGVSQNTKGKVELKKNRLGPKTPKVVLKDAISTKPSHDIKGLKCAAELKEVQPNSHYTRRERSEYTEKVSCGAGEFSSHKDLSDPRYKRCERCNYGQGFLFNWQGQEQSGEKKFQYCSKCRSVCYCSKECQIAHWPDHKLICHKLGKKSKK